MINQNMYVLGDGVTDGKLPFISFDVDVLYHDKPEYIWLKGMDLDH